MTRIAPSPTGVMHVGTARTALFNYLFARQNNGRFILRIEDTDTERSKNEYEDDIINALNQLGLNYDDFYRQSDRSEIYQKYLTQMIDSGSAYISKESGGDREEVIRFKNTNSVIKFNDIVRGEIEFDTTELGDFVIAKSLKEPLYHLAVVVDDHEMGVTHIIRGEDGISNTPRQILIQRAICAKTPQYGHLPLILGPDKSKLSKRHGAVSISEYLRQGYLSDAINNYLAMLGWNPGNDKEIFSINELIDIFDITKIQKGGAVFNLEKLNWFNRAYLQKLPLEKATSLIKTRLVSPDTASTIPNPTDDQLRHITPIIIERIEKLSDIDELIKNRELDYYFAAPAYDPHDLIWKETGIEKTLLHLKKVYEILMQLNNPAEAKTSIWPYAKEEGRGDVLWPLRFALSGAKKSPDPFALISAIGITESRNRVENAIKKLNEMDFDGKSSDE